ncbi:hypothetical protein L218DRAFT_468784 [Marasmius fiardii PR-910]|nr:hypothetical protein L218DRAFT_468784 [Marasmius fiardii PR-910]
MKLYVGTQKHSETMVHDGLRNSQGPDTSSPYVTAYHPVFQDFIRDLHDPLLPMPPELPAFDDVNVFMDHSAVIAKINEDEVNATLRLRLSRCLGNRVLDAAPGPTKAVPDGWWRARVHGNLLEFPSFIWENKLGLGDGGGDAVVQCALSWRRAILDAISKYPECLATKSNCPTFMLATVGSWMCVIGGVFVERLIVQRLTPFLSTAGPELASMGSIRLKQITRVFMCLSRGLYRIERYYEALAGQAISPLNILNVDVPDESHPRNFPYPNSYQGPNGDAIKFEYIRSLHLHPRYRAQCATFLARESSNDYIVVKFVSRGHYGFEAHQLVLDDHNTAPHIRYYGPLPSHTLYGSDSTWTPAGWYAPPLTVFSPTTYSDLEMVVMEYIPSIQSPTLKEIETGLKELAKVIKGLHDKGYVFGDLREPNVIFSPQGVKLIDFDWAGRFDPNATPSNRTSPREDIARYPSRLTTHGIRWPEGAASLSRRPILPNDDDFMYTQLEHALLSRYK